MNDILQPKKDEKKVYIKPEVQKHKPVAAISGSSDDSCNNYSSKDSGGSYTYYYYYYT